MKFVIDYGISYQGVKRLSDVVSSFIPDISLIHIYDNALYDILHNSILSKVRYFCVYCSVCEDMLMTNSIFCPNCKSALITSCTMCGLRKNTLNRYTNTYIECNHHVRVSHNPTYTYYSLSGALTEMWLEGTIQQNIGYTPSEAMAIITYCKEAGVYNSFVDMNAAVGWRAINRGDIADAIENNLCFPDFPKSLSERIDNMSNCESPEQHNYRFNGYYHIMDLFIEKSEVYLEFCSKGITKKEINEECKVLKQKVRDLIERVRLLDSQLKVDQKQFECLFEETTLENLLRDYDNLLFDSIPLFLSTENTKGFIDEIEGYERDGNRLLEKSLLIGNENSKKLKGLLELIKETCTSINAHYTSAKVLLFVYGISIRSCEYRKLFKQLKQTRDQLRCEEDYEKAMAYLSSIDVITKQCNSMLDTLNIFIDDSKKDIAILVNLFSEMCRRHQVAKLKNEIDVWKNRNCPDYIYSGINQNTLVPIVTSLSDYAIVYFIRNSDKNDVMNTMEKCQQEERNDIAEIMNSIEEVIDILSTQDENQTQNQTQNVNSRPQRYDCILIYNEASHNEQKV